MNVSGGNAASAEPRPIHPHVTEKPAVFEKNSTLGTPIAQGTIGTTVITPTPKMSSSSTILHSDSPLDEDSHELSEQELQMLKRAQIAIQRDEDGDL